MKVVKSFGLFLSFFLSIIFFLILCIGTTILFFKNTVSESQIKSYINSVDIYNLKSNDLTENKDNITLEEAIKSELKKNNLPTSLLDEIIKNESFINFLSNYSYRYINYILKDEVKPILTRQDIYNVINIPTVEYHLNRSLTEEEKDNFNKLVDEIILSLNQNIIERNEYVNKNFDKILNIIYLDNINIYLIIGLVSIIILLFILTFSIYKPFIFLSIPLTIWGIILSLLHLMTKLLIKFIITTDGIIENIIKSLINKLSFNILEVGLGFIIVGIIFYIIYRLLKKKLHKEEDVFLDIEDNINPKLKEKVLK